MRMRTLAMILGAIAIAATVGCDSGGGCLVSDGGACVLPDGGNTGWRGWGGGGAGGGGGGAGGSVSAADRAAFDAFEHRFVAAFCDHLVTCGFAADPASCAVEADTGKLGTCASAVDYYESKRTALEACVSQTSASCTDATAGTFCAAASGIEAVADSCFGDGGTGGAGGGDGGVGTDAGGGGGTGGGQSLTTDQLAVGAWSGGATCSSSTDTIDISYTLLLCPGGRLRGAESVGGYDFVDCGSWSAGADDVHLDYSATAVADSTYVDQSTADFTYASSSDTLTWVSGCAISLTRAVGSLSAEDCESSACTAGGQGSVSCGTDCDCGRCWYCESGTCRYAGEGPYGCFRGCQ